MAVTAVGTPSAISSITTTNTTVSATNAWSATQPRTAGDLLVMIVTASAATSVTLPTVPAGWTQAANIGNAPTSPHTAVAVFWAIASGGDAAPTSQVTVAGSSAQVDCLLLEFSGASSSPVGASGTYASGSSSATLTGATVTTSSAVPGAGGYGLAVFGTERSSSQAITWAPGVGWTNLENDGSNSGRDHQAIDTYANPPSGSALSDAATFTSISSAFAAAAIVVFQAPGAIDSGSAALAAAARISASGTTQTAGSSALAAAPLLSAPASTFLGGPASLLAAPLLLTSITISRTGAISLRSAPALHVTAASAPGLWEAYTLAAAQAARDEETWGEAVQAGGRSAAMGIYYDRAYKSRLAASLAYDAWLTAQKK